MQKTAKKKTKSFQAVWKWIGLILLGILVLVSLLAFATERWLFQTWASLDMDEIMFHLNSSLQGTNPEMVRAYLLHYAIFALLVFLVFVISMILT